jgi:DNA (cytosine-5)-methyltransferase 1
MKVGSLFSGIGGIEIGFEKQGFTTEWFVECDTYARAVLTKRFPETPIYGDITEIDFRTVPKVDIITGGFPCQDISNAGKRVGIEGSRSSLWKYYRDAIREIRPKFALIENVAALTRRGLNVVLADLAEIGYDAEWYNISASAVGALHRRERIFIIASDPLCRREHGEQCKESIRKTVENVENPCCDGSNEGNRDAFTRGETSTEHSNKSISTGWWSTEPDVDRVVNGISNRVDRIKCLGNAVVPQVAEVFAQAIKIKQGEREC